VRDGDGEGPSRLTGDAPQGGGTSDPSSLTDADERPHRPGAAQLWGESWDFDFAGVDGTLGGYVRLGVYPNLGAAWFWASLVGSGRPLVAVRDQDVPLPRRAATEVRAEGLWSAFTCETPFEHWSVGMEAFAVALDEPAEAYAGERGDRIALGLDLEWESAVRPVPLGAGPAGPGPSGTSYGQPCEVYGEILVGDERIEFSGPGQREHAWGENDWWRGPRWRAAGRLLDGRSFSAWGDGMLASGAAGYVVVAGEAVRATLVTVDSVLTPDGLASSASLVVDGLALTVTPLAHAPVVLEAPDGRRSRLARALCRFDGRQDEQDVTAVGWSEWLLPP
jgi:hypothetical protein